MKPESYPFLRIARQCAVEYGDVLAYAQTFKSSASVEFIETTRARLSKVWGLGQYRYIVDEIAAITRQFEAIQAGEIDWLTGEPVDHA